MLNWNLEAFVTYVQMLILIKIQRFYFELLVYTTKIFFNEIKVVAMNFTENRID